MFIIWKLLARTCCVRVCEYEYAYAGKKERYVVFSMSVILKRVNVDCRINDFDQFQKHFHRVFYLNLGWTFEYVWVWQRKRISVYIVCLFVLFFFHSYAYTDYLNVTCKIWHMRTFKWDYVCAECVWVYIIYSYLTSEMKKGQKVKRRRTATSDTHTHTANTH